MNKKDFYKMAGDLLNDTCASAMEHKAALSWKMFRLDDGQILIIHCSVTAITPNEQKGN